MKILITGKPKSGKSTLMKAIIDAKGVPVRGLLTNEVRIDGKRTGFSIMTSLAEEIELAQISKPSPIKVGKFFVNESFLDEHFDQLFNISSNEWLYIDEIGEMQMYSSHFSKLVDSYVTSANNLIATVSSVFTNKQINDILAREDAVTMYLDETSRLEALNLINKIIGSIHYYNRLDENIKNVILSLANSYLKQGNYTSASKLFDKAIAYFSETKVKEVDTGKYQVTGEHSSYMVNITEDSWSCECKLSLGKKPYKQPEECSHYQATIIYLSSL